MGYWKGHEGDWAHLDVAGKAGSGQGKLERHCWWPMLQDEQWAVRRRYTCQVSLLLFHYSLGTEWGGMPPSSHERAMIVQCK